MQSAIKTFTKNTGSLQMPVFTGTIAGYSVASQNECKRSPLEFYGKSTNSIEAFKDVKSCDNTDRSMLAKVNGGKIDQYNNTLLTEAKAQKEGFKNKYPPMNEISEASRVSLQEQYNSVKYGVKVVENEKNEIVENYATPPPPTENLMPCDVVIACGKHLSRDVAIQSNPLCEKVNADVDFRRCAGMKPPQEAKIAPFLTPKPVTNNSSMLIMGRM